MKLKNKKTGKILDFYLKVIWEDNTYDDYFCESLKEFNEEWMDV